MPDDGVCRAWAWVLAERAQWNCCGALEAPKVGSLPDAHQVQTCTRRYVKSRTNARRCLVKVENVARLRRPVQLHSLPPWTSNLDGLSLQRRVLFWRRSLLPSPFLPKLRHCPEPTAPPMKLMRGSTRARPWPSCVTSRRAAHKAARAASDWRPPGNDAVLRGIVSSLRGAPVSAQSL